MNYDAVSITTVIVISLAHCPGLMEPMSGIVARDIYLYTTHNTFHL
jgi:hypothetical protein